MILQDGLPDCPVEGLIAGRRMGDRSLSDHPAVAPWKTLNTREILNASPWLKVFVEQVELPGGRTVDHYYQVYMPASVLVFARTDDGRVVVERAYRHGLRRVSLLFPAGGIAPGEDSLDAAKRELLEETGFAARHWSRLGSFAGHTNQGCGRIHMFEATGAHRVREPESGDLEEIQVLQMTDDELSDAIRSGEMITLSCVALAMLAAGLRF